MPRLALLIIAPALLLCAGMAEAQFIRNGTLDANASGWKLFSSCGDVIWDDGAGNPAGSIRLNSCGQGDTDPTAAQSIDNLVAGATYTISVDVRLYADSSGDGTGKSFGIFLDNEPGNPLLLDEFLDDNWHTVTTTFVATSRTARIIFAAELDARTPGGPGQNTDVAYSIDNISVAGPVAPPLAAVSVPGLSDAALITLGLLLVTCAGTMIAMRKTRAAR